MKNDYLKQYQEICDKIKIQQEINRNKPLSDNELLFLIWYNKQFKKYQEELNMEMIYQQFNKYKYVNSYKIREIKKDIDILNYFVIEFMRKNNMNSDAIMIFNAIGELRPNKSKISRKLTIESVIEIHKREFNSIIKEYHDFRYNYITRENKIKFEQEYEVIWIGEEQIK